MCTSFQPAYGCLRSVQSTDLKYDPSSLCQSPLLRFRQRSFARQSVALFEKAYQELNQSKMINLSDSRCNLPSPSLCSPVFPLEQSFEKHAWSDYSINGEMCQTVSATQFPLPRRPSVTSPLYMWRENKLKQNAPCKAVHAATQPVFLNCRNRSIPPELSIYRGRARQNSQEALPVNLCDSLEKLFRSHSESNCKRIPTVSPMLPAIYFQR